MQTIQKLFQSGAFVGVVLPLKIEAVYIICNLLPISPKISGHIELKGGGEEEEREHS